MIADLNRVVIEGSRELGKRVERQDDGFRTDLKNLHESCSRLYVCKAENGSTI